MCNFIPFHIYVLHGGSAPVSFFSSSFLKNCIRLVFITFYLFRLWHIFILVYWIVTVFWRWQLSLCYCSIGWIKLKNKIYIYNTTIYTPVVPMPVGWHGLFIWFDCCETFHCLPLTILYGFWYDGGRLRFRWKYQEQEPRRERKKNWKR